METSVYENRHVQTAIYILWLVITRAIDVINLWLPPPGDCEQDLGEWWKHYKSCLKNGTPPNPVEEWSKYYHSVLQKYTDNYHYCVNKLRCLGLSHEVIDHVMDLCILSKIAPSRYRIYLTFFKEHNRSVTLLFDRLLPNFEDNTFKVVNARMEKKARKDLDKFRAFAFYGKKMV